MLCNLSTLFQWSWADLKNENVKRCQATHETWIPFDRGDRLASAWMRQACKKWVEDIFLKIYTFFFFLTAQIHYTVIMCLVYQAVNVFVAKANKNFCQIYKKKTIL